MSKVVNGGSFKHTFDRAGTYYAASTAPTSRDPGQASVRELMLKIYEIFANTPEACGLKAAPDAPLTTWEPVNARKDDVKRIRDAFDQISRFEEELFDFVTLARITEDGLSVPKAAYKASRLFTKVLDAAGVRTEIGDETVLFLDRSTAEALRELAASCEKASSDSGGTPDRQKAAVLFSRVVYDHSADWMSENLDAILKADGALLRFCRALSDRGFRFQAFIDGRQLSLNYIRDFGDKPSPLKRAFGERQHLGFEATLEDIRKTPVVFTLRIPYYRAVLENFEKLSRETAEFVFSHTKDCDGCGYCVKTDRTGTKPFVNVEGNGVKKCPLFPCFRYTFTEFSDDTAAAVLKLFDEITAEIPAFSDRGVRSVNS